MKHNEAVEILEDTVRYFKNAGLHDYAARISSIADGISGGTLQKNTTREEIMSILRVSTRARKF